MQRVEDEPDYRSGNGVAAPRYSRWANDSGAIQAATPSSAVHSLASVPSQRDVQKDNAPRLRLVREAIKGKLNVLMGTAWRSSMTGQVHIPPEELKQFPNFSVVDLWTREPRLSGTLEHYNKDEYLFRPVPLLYRTWIYHYYYTTKHVHPEPDEHGMMKSVLEHMCIDARTHAGRWSSLVFVAPGVFFTCTTGNMAVVVPGLFLVAIIFAVDRLANTPAQYGFTRVYTSFVRLPYFILCLVHLGQSVFAAIGLTIAIFLLGLDIFFGDFEMLRNSRLNCQYEVIRALPNRVLVCRRHGAVQNEKIYGLRGQVDECVSGVATWATNMYLIADIQGLLVELRPMSEKEWVKLNNVYQILCTSNTQAAKAGKKMPSYYGLDTYSDIRPSLDAMDATPEETKQIAKKTAQKRIPNVDEDPVVQQITFKDVGETPSTRMMLQNM